jgi:hypothetical protein
MIKLRIFRFVAVTVGAAVLLFVSFFAPIRARIFNKEAIQISAGDSLAEGTWTVDLDAYRDARHNGLLLEFHKDNSTWVHSISSERAPRLDAQIENGGDIHFTIQSDPGDLEFTGTIVKKIAKGKYRFKPNAAFVAEGSKLLKQDLSQEDLLEFLFSDISLEYIRGMAGAGIDVNAKSIRALRNHGVQLKQAKEFAEAGFKNPDDLVRFRDHGVQPTLARDAKNFGFARGAEEIVRLRDHGVSPEYLQGWKEAEFKFSADELVRMRDHGLKADYAAAWKKAGFNLSADDLIRARDFGVPTEFATALGASAPRPTIDEAIRMRQFGVDAKYYRAIRELNAGYTVEDIVRFKQFGVPVDYISAINVAGRPAVDSQTIIDLRNRGVSPETARKLRQ